jgi:hypothetical protein
VVNGPTVHLPQEHSIFAKDRPQAFLDAVSFHLWMIYQPDW